MVKRMVAGLCVIALLLAGCGGGGSTGSSLSGGEDKTVKSAIRELTGFWRELNDGDDYTDGYLEIKNTRLIVIRGGENEFFQDIQYIVEFSLLSDYYASAPYYTDVKMYDCVVFYRDGTVEVPTRNPIEIYRARTYENDFSDFMEDIKDAGSAYNETFRLK